MKKIFALALLLCLENAFAIDCSGNLYVKVPEDWTEAYATSQNCSGITALT